MRSAVPRLLASLIRSEGSSYAPHNQESSMSRPWPAIVVERGEVRLEEGCCTKATPRSVDGDSHGKRFQQDALWLSRVMELPPPRRLELLLVQVHPCMPKQRIRRPPQVAHQGADPTALDQPPAVAWVPFAAGLAQEGVEVLRAADGD